MQTARSQLTRIINTDRLWRGTIIATTCFAYLFVVQCATAPVKPYQVTNFFRSSRLEERGIRRIAVLPFENLTEERFAGPIVAEETNLQVGKLGVFDLVERSKVVELFREQDLDTLERFDANTAVKIGKMLGAQGVIVGSVTKFKRHPSDKQDTVVIVEKEHRYSPWEDEWYYHRHHRHRYDYGSHGQHSGRDTSGVDPWLVVGIVALTITIIGGILYLVLREKPASAEVGASLRMVDVETGEVVWQANETFQGNRASVQALVTENEDRARLVTDAEYLTQILCRELARTLVGAMLPATAGSVSESGPAVPGGCQSVVADRRLRSPSGRNPVPPSCP